MKEESVVKMEFLLTLNNNIVVQRYYNVKNFNSKARSSVELSSFMKEVEVMLFEPATTLNTGNIMNEKTVNDPEKI